MDEDRDDLPVDGRQSDDCDPVDRPDPEYRSGVPTTSGSGPDPLRFSNWTKRTATGSVLLGIARGLREALEPARNEVAVVVESTEPDDRDQPISLRVDPDDPTATVAFVRRPPSEPKGS